MLSIAAHADQGARIIELTQTHCQFLETEGVDHQFSARSAAECERINAQTGDKRIANSQTLSLSAGKYIFRVSNRDVPYELGF